MTKELNFTEVFEDHSKEGFRTRIRTNKIAPRGLEPMRVVEFSLMHEVRRSLEKALEAYFDQNVHKLDYQELAAIVEAHMPVQIIEQLKEFSRTDSRTVFVIHNLPERNKGKDIPSAYEKESREPQRMIAHSYVACIQFGLAEILQLNKRKPLYTSMNARKHDSQTVTGEGFHNHNEDVTLFGVMFVDKQKKRAPATGFLDSSALLEEAMENPELGKVPLFSFRENTSVFRLRDYEGKAPREINILKCLPGSTEYQVKFDRAIARYSQKIEGRQGSLILWPNKDVLHQAIRSPISNPELKGHYSRIVIVTGCDRSETVSR